MRLHVRDPGPRLTDAAARAAARSSRLGNLRELRLDRQDTGPAGAAALAGVTFAPRLESLDLSECGIGDAGARVLARAAFPRLDSLRLWSTPLSPPVREARALDCSDALAGLKVKCKGRPAG